MDWWSVVDEDYRHVVVLVVFIIDYWDGCNIEVLLVRNISIVSMAL